MKLDRFTPQAMMFYYLALQFEVDIDRNCGKERAELDKSKKLMEDAIGNNMQLKSLLERLIEAYDKSHFESIPHYYKNGFIYGAQLMMEILGCSIANDDKDKLDELLSYLAKMQ